MEGINQQFELNELVEIKKMLRKLLEHFDEPMNSKPKDRLITSGQVLERLGMKHDEKAWHKTRKILQERYGMGRVSGTGFRMPESQLEKFIAEHYSPTT